MATAVPTEGAVAACLHGLWKGVTATRAEKPGTALPQTQPNTSSQIETEIDWSRLFLMCKSELNGTIFLEDTEVLRALWTKSLVVTCIGVLCHWSTTVVAQKY